MPHTPPTTKASTANVTSLGMIGLCRFSMTERESTWAMYAEYTMDVMTLAPAPAAKPDCAAKEPAVTPGTRGVSEPKMS